MYALFGDSDFTARLAPGADGHADGRRSPTCCARSSAASARSPPPRCSPSARPTCTSPASPARTSTSPRSRSRCSSSPSASSTRPRRHQPGADRRAAGARASPPRRRRSSPVFVAGTFFLVVLAVPARGRLLRRRVRAPSAAGGVGLGRWPRSSASSRCSSRRSSPTPSGVRRALRRARLLARPARASAAAARRGTSTSSSCSRDEWPVLLLGAVGAVVALRRPTLLRAVPDLGLRALAGRLLVGGREVRLAGAAPAAAAAAARRPRRAGDLGRRGARWHGKLGLAVVGAGARLRRATPRALVNARPPRRPARVPGLHAVLGGGQAASRDEVVALRRAPRAGKLDDHRRLRRGRDVPVGVVLPRPRRRLPGPHRRRAAAARRRRR